MENEIDDTARRELASELDNFEEIARCLNPSAGQIPQLAGLDIAGKSMPLRGRIGGDHIIYIDFRKRFDIEARIARAEADNNTALVEMLHRTRDRAGILVADVSGHQMTDAMIGAMLHQAFLLGAIYEMDQHGEITTRLFEHINTRFYQSSAIHKYLTMIYGEISTSGVFRFISAGHPPPIVFSRRFARIADIAGESLKRYPPIGIVPSGDDVDRARLIDPLKFKERYSVNELSLLGSGDVLLLATDGLYEHGDDSYVPDALEKQLAQTRDLSAREIADGLKRSLLAFAPPKDDISFVVIKRG
jgi:serine phosphatase RsbU (regulator of sigma subunit)